MKKALFSILLSLSVIFNLTAKDKPQDLPDTTQILESINYFDSGLFGQLDNGRDNLNYSALSIYNLLYALLKGAQGQTKDQLCKALGLTDSEEVDRQLAAIISNTENMTNSIWYKDTLLLLPDYRKKILAFDFMLKPRDFTRTADTRKTINSFISKNTKGLIPEFLKEDLDPQTRFVLLNTLYFEQKWKNAFNTHNTWDRTFYKNKDTKLTVPMMTQTKTFKYCQDKDFQALELEYEDQRYSMIIFLPWNKEYDFSTINPNQLARDFYRNDKAHYESVEVTIPKFDLTSTYDLVPVLEAMGISDIFNPAKAELPNIVMNKKGPLAGQENLFVDTAIHQVRIIVNEKETKAAAVTMFASKATSAAPREPIYFTADHPFVYVIRDKKLNLNLFTGIIRNP